MLAGSGSAALRRSAVLCLSLILLASTAATADAGRRMDFQELMKLRKITSSAISDDGQWVSYIATPDRGDGYGGLVDAQGRHERRIEGASSFSLAARGGYASFVVGPSFEDRQTKEKDELDKNSIVLVRGRDGEQWRFERVKSDAFSEDGAWWACLHEEVEEVADSTATDEEEPADAAVEEGSDSEDEDSAEREAGTELVLRRLVDGRQWSIASVTRYAFDPTSQQLAVVIATETGEENALQLWSLGDEPTASSAHARAMAAYPAMTWARDLPRLAFVVGDEEEPGKLEGLELHAFVEGDRRLARAEDLPEGMDLAEENQLTWSLDGDRLFFGMLAKEEESEGETTDDAVDDVATEETEETPYDPYDFDAILEDREVDVWNWQDPRIKTHEKKSYEERNKEQRLAVVHLESGKVVALADDAIPSVSPELEAGVVLASTEVPYLRQQTWGWFYQDYYLIDLATGERSRVVEKSSDTVSISPEGDTVVFYRDGAWFATDLAEGSTTELTAELDVPFANEDHDYPYPTPGYGVGGWIRGGGGVLVYDKYDLWRLWPDGRSLCLTGGQGRAEHLQFRVIDTDAELEGFREDEPLMLSAFDEDTKASYVYRVDPSGEKLEQLHGGDYRVRFRAKAKDADRVLYTEEDYDRFPDLRTARMDFRDRKQVSDVNPELRDFDLGHSELVEWLSLDGIPTQGILIKPPNYDPKKRYPVLVYYYRFFSQRLHDFNDPVVNHRPSFYVYTGDDYCVFLPDIRFEIGRPGLAATKSLVPGVQMLIDRGIAKADAVALHGHSWSGYQTAQMITQTDLFACAVAGAPVSNMTSAYGGIRWGSGMSRQFQYEMGQSRIGATLWNGLERYIDNSPVFFADRIHTPLLIEFGDEDGAVPWTQGIELYMAMRRLDRPCVMLQYRGEPHHLKKYPNKLDYSLKMKAFIDHFCKGTPAPDWWTEGAPYTGD